MMKTISNSVLLENTQKIVAEERRITLELLTHLREIERRMLFAEMGYSSLFEFTVKHLGLSDGSAYRRIAAMRLMKEVPQIQESISEGKLTLCSAAKLQSFFRAEKKSGTPLTTEAKKAVIEKVSGLTTRECEQKLFEISPTSIPRERQRVVSSTETELRIIVDQEFMELLLHLKGLLAHRLSNASNSEILKWALKETVTGLLRLKMGAAS